MFIIAIIMANLIFADPCSAPWLGASHSGAPGEVSCLGCHSGSANSGPGTITYLIGDGNGTNHYSPSELYDILFSMEQDNVNQFGFQTVALKASNNSNVGTFSLTDEVNTRLIEDDHNGTDRIYVGHTVCGADADTEGSLQWSFKWKAPESDVGDIKFYLSSLATNHNHSTSGDHTYTQVITMSYNDVVLGDLDGNGAINILDVVLLVNIVLGVLDPTSQQEISADLNADSTINILDVVQLVNMILSS